MGLDDIERGNRTMDHETVILLGHGSRDPAALAEFSAFTEFFKQTAGRPRTYPAYLELAPPEIPEAIDQAVVLGARRIFALPLFLFPGRHVLEDLPQILAEAQRKYPETEIRFSHPLDAFAATEALALKRILQISPLPVKPEQTGLLLVGRGTLEPKAMEATAQMARSLAPRLPYPWVEHCFAEVVPPHIPEGVQHLVDQGARAVIVFPALLFTGIIIQRIVRRVEDLRLRYPNVPIVLAPYLGIHPLLAEAVAAQLDSAIPIGDGQTTPPF